MIYSPDQFTISDHGLLFRVMRENSFATLVVGNGDEPIIAHLPVSVDEVNNRLYAHVARPNPVWKEFSPTREALFIFHGPHHYVSPNWYSDHPSVPTWNYVVVHTSGKPTIIDDRETIERLLHRLVDEHESRSATPWKMDLPADYLRKMIDGIVAFEVQITRLQGKFKLSQNRSRVDQSNVIAALERANGDSAVHLAELMKRVLRS